MTSPGGPPRVVIVGGGITGLAAAHRLVELAREAGGAPSVVLIEARDRPGGQIRTERRGDFLFEGGPDTLVAQKPAGIALCERIGLGGELDDVRGHPGGAQILHRGRLVRIPDGFVMMAPVRWRPTLASPLFSWRGKLRLAAEPWVRPRPARIDDESLASFVTRRFGREVLERVAEPVIASLYTADADALSLRMTMPRFLDMEANEGSVTRGLRRQARAVPREGFGHGTGRGGFVAVRGGMSRIVDSLVARLPVGSLRTGVRVTGLDGPSAGTPWRVRLEGQDPVAADAVILACPAFEAERLLHAHDGALAADLARVRYASCATVTLVYRRADLLAPPATFGFFVPRTEGIPVLACSFVSEKFPGRAPSGSVVVRTFLGGATREGVLDGDDAHLARVSHDLLRRVLSIVAEPQHATIYRFPDAMPQFEVGGLRRTQELSARAASHPGLFLAGSMAGAVGLPDCIRSGEDAAAEVARFVRRNQGAAEGEPIVPGSSGWVAYQANQNA